jgi:acyl carrier protein
MPAPYDGPATGATDVLPELAEIVHLVTDRRAEEVRPERAFVDELRIDSLAMVEILEGAARHFGVRIEDEDAKYFVRVQDLVDYITSRLSQTTRQSTS